MYKQNTFHLQFFTKTHVLGCFTIHQFLWPALLKEQKPITTTAMFNQIGKSASITYLAL